MRLLGNIKEIKSRLNAAPSKDVLRTTRNWFNDRYEWVVIQRNMLFLLTLVCVVSIIVLTAGISYIKTTRTIEPFVIEIEPKTGFPTVVVPKDSQALSQDEAVLRFYIWYYLRMREEYYAASFWEMRKAVSTMSDGAVFQDYARDHGPNNPQSDFNILGSGGVRNIELKNILIETKPSTDQQGVTTYKYVVVVRFKSIVKGVSIGAPQDKYVRMECEMRNLTLSEDARLLNPLGFFVTKYQISDENVN